MTVLILAAGSVFNDDRAAAFEACQPESPLFVSSNSSEAINMSVSADKNVGKHSLAVIIYWINQQGKHVRHHQLFPGQSYQVKTYDGHKWVAKDAHDQCMYFTAQKNQWNIFHIKYDEGP